MQRKPDILAGIALSLVIAVAGAWLLIGHWKGQTPVEPPQAEAMARQADLNTQLMQETLGERIATAPADEQQQRMDAPLGLALFRKCAEWAEFNDNHPSVAARDNEIKACAEYRQYIETGEVPE